MAIPAIRTLSYKKSQIREGEPQSNSTFDKSSYPQPIVIKDWQELLVELKSMGYSLAKFVGILQIAQARSKFKLRQYLRFLWWESYYLL